MKEIQFNINLFKWVNLIATFFIIIGIGIYSTYWVIAIVAGAVWVTFISLIIAVCNLLIKIYEELKNRNKND